MKGKFFCNRYYSDAGTEYAAQRLREVLRSEGIALTVENTPLTAFAGTLPDCDFAVFWDKDTVAASALYSRGLKVFNEPDAILVCDDKARTYAALAGSGIPVPETIVSPLVYDVSAGDDEEFYTVAEALCGYPMVFKLSVGSQGRQVDLVQNRRGLMALRKQYIHTPHMLQRYYDCADLRVYAVAGEVVAAMRRTPKPGGFKSNRAAGGTAELIAPDERLCAYATRIAETLHLDYFAADFLDADEPRLLEVNSNAYFHYAEFLGTDIAGAYGRHIAAVMRRLA